MSAIMRPEPASLYIQWKGTDLCADFKCQCGAQHHIDAMFVYNIECSCGAVYKVPDTLQLERIPESADLTHVCSQED